MIPKWLWVFCDICHFLSIDSSPNEILFFNFVVFRSYKRVFESRGFEIKKPWYGNSPLCKWPDPGWPSVTCGGGWAVVSPSSLTVGVASCVLTGKGKKFVCFCLFLDTGNASMEGYFKQRKEICLFYSLHMGRHSKYFYEATFKIKCLFSSVHKRRHIKYIYVKRLLRITLTVFVTS